MTTTASRRAALLAVGAGCLAARPGSLWAQPAFPTKPLKLVVPFPPGGSTDALARQMAEELAKRWGQPVVIENKPGANTMLGTDLVAKSAPDGHTLGIVSGLHMINPLLTDRLPYDTLRDLTGVMQLTRFDMAFYAHPSFPASSLAELVALAKKSQPPLACASVTTGAYLGMELFNSMAGIKMQNIPYKGSAQATTDLLGGHIKLLIDPLAQSSVEHVRAGRLKLLGTLGSQPSPLMPNAPVAASVVPGYEFVGVFGLVVRAGTPPELVRRIRDDVAAVLNSPEVLARVRDIGQEPVASTPEQFNAYIVADMKKWEPIVRATGARIQ